MAPLQPGIVRNTFACSSALGEQATFGGLAMVGSERRAETGHHTGRLKCLCLVPYDVAASCTVSPQLI